MGIGTLADVLQIHTAGRIEPLVGHLAGVLSAPPLGRDASEWDPFAPEWIAVPTEGMRRWLHLELARHLGAGPDGGDGVVANVISAGPASLRQALLDAAAEGEDPWRVERMAWSVLAELQLTDDQALHRVRDVRDGASHFARARRIADLFDRYHVHRADMVRAWSAGADVDGAGRQLVEHQRWQPELWRRVRQRIGVPSPPEQLLATTDQLLSGALRLDLPDRLCMFGLSALPGGVTFLDLAEAVGTHRDVHLYLVEPSPTASARVVASVGPPPEDARLRSDDRSADLVQHPLLRSWGRLHRETTVLLADAQSQGMRAVDQLDAPDVGVDATSLMGRLQDDLRRDREPAGDLVPAAGDRSVQLHAAHGDARQVEVLRDVLLHLLDDPELDLVEDDIVVMSPALDQLAPVIHAVLGPSAGASSSASGPAADGTPFLRYRIADRSLGSTTPLLDALDRTLALVTGRFDVVSVLDLVALVPVRTRFGFTDDDVARVGEWAEQARVRWGLDEQQRALAGLPAEFDTNTWRAALDRLLLGSSVAAEEQLGLGDVVALPIDSSEAPLAGRLAQLLWRLEQLAEQARVPRPVAEWIDVVRAAALELFAVDRDDSWQLDALGRLLGDLAERAGGEPATAQLPVDFLDLRRALGEGLAAAPGRADFFRGGITISSMTPLRGVPFRVVVLLGVDQPAFSVGSPEGDDLVAATPQLGDGDRRGESRQAMLDAVLAARERLVLIREGNDVRTNQAVPRSVPVAELVDALLAAVHPDHRAALEERLEVRHPRQAFDRLAFTPGALVDNGVWSFDEGAYRGALAREARRGTAEDFLRHRLAPPDEPVIELAELHDFLRDPTGHFVRRRLGVRLPAAAESPSVIVPLNLSGLDRWDVGSRLFAWLLGGGDADDWARLERRRGTLGPGSLGQATLDEVHEVAAALVAAAARLGVRAEPLRTVPVDVTLPDGTRVVGAVADRLDGRPGAARTTYSTDRPGYLLGTWLDLVALVAHDPTQPWRSVSVAKGQGKEPAATHQLEVPGGVDERGAAALAGLGAAVECYRRGSVEPLPLFPTVSYALWARENPHAHWVRYQGGGDGATEATRLVYGERDLRELLRLPRQDDDPVTRSGVDAGRLQCWAEHLWDAVVRSSAAVADPAVADPGVADPAAMSTAAGVAP